MVTRQTDQAWLCGEDRDPGFPCESPLARASGLFCILEGTSRGHTKSGERLPVPAGKAPESCARGVISA